MTSENRPHVALFDLDSLNQHSEYAARKAYNEEAKRIDNLFDSEVVRSFCGPLGTRDTGVRQLDKARTDFLRYKALGVVTGLQMDPSAVRQTAIEFASIFLIQMIQVGNQS